MSDLPFDYPSVANPGTPPPRKCSHPRQHRIHHRGADQCARCGHVFDPARQAMGRRNRSRGNAKERATARRNGTERTGQHGGKDDFRTPLFAFQNKSMATARFPGWMTSELDALRMAWPDREPVLHVEESPGSGSRPRRLYVVDEATWIALHGPTGDAA